MPQNLSQQQQLRLSQRLAPMQVRYVRLLEMNRAEAEDAVYRELVDNPALAVADDPASAPGSDSAPALRSQQEAGLEQRRMERDNFSSEDDMPYYLTRDYLPSGRSDELRNLQFAQTPQRESLYEHLLSQLAQKDLDADTLRAARYIIGNLDSNGYLSRSIESMVDDLAFNQGVEIPVSVMRRALDEVRSLEPPGIGGSSLQEVLAFQLEAMPGDRTRDDALRIVHEAFEALSMRHSHRIISQLKLPEERYKEAMRLILSLNPRPGSAFGSAEGAAAAVPDFEIEEDSEGRLRVSVPSSIPALVIDESFAAAQADLSRNSSQRKEHRKANEFVNSRYNDARDFIAVVRQRRQTLMDVITAVARLQERYIRTSDEADLRPMALKDVASLTGLDVSTVSRATAGKYVALPWGIIPMKHLFSEGYADTAGGAEISTRSVKAAIREIIEAEDKRHPLSDESLMQELTARGFSAKRRTVAKYREQMGFPPARLRKQM